MGTFIYLVIMVGRLYIFMVSLVASVLYLSLVQLEHEILTIRPVIFDTSGSK